MQSMSVVYLLVVWLTYFNLVASDLIINALASDENGDTRFQCWQMPDPFKEPSTMLGGAEWWKFIIIGPGQRRELLRTTSPRFTFALTGKCQVWLPDDSEELWLGGADPVAIIVADVNSKGHYAWHQSLQPSLEVQVNFVDDIVPGHTVLYNGTCKARDLRSTYDTEFLNTLRTRLQPNLDELLGSLSEDDESLSNEQHLVERPSAAAERTRAATTAKASTVDAIWREVHFTEQAQQQPFV